MSNLQLNRLKSRIKNNTEVTLKLPSNVAGDSNNENNFSHKLLLNNSQVLKALQSFCKWFISYYKITKNSFA